MKARILGALVQSSGRDTVPKVRSERCDVELVATAERTLIVAVTSGPTDIQDPSGKEVGERMVKTIKDFEPDVVLFDGGEEEFIEACKVMEGLATFGATNRLEEILAMLAKNPGTDEADKLRYKNVEGMREELTLHLAQKRYEVMRVVAAMRGAKASRSEFRFSYPLDDARILEGVDRYGYKWPSDASRLRKHEESYVRIELDPGQQEWNMESEKSKKETVLRINAIENEAERLAHTLLFSNRMSRHTRGFRRIECEGLWKAFTATRKRLQLRNSLDVGARRICVVTNVFQTMLAVAEGKIESFRFKLLTLGSEEMLEETIVI